MIPKVSLREGDSTHDVEFNENPDAFLLRCEQAYGTVFQIQCLNQSLIVVSGPSLAREIHLHEGFSFRDAVEHMTGYRAFIHSVIKSHKDIDSMLHFQLLREGVSTKLSSFTPEIVQRMAVTLEQQIGSSEGDEPKLIEWPLVALQNIVAATSKCLFPSVVRWDMCDMESVGCVFASLSSLKLCPTPFTPFVWSSSSLWLFLFPFAHKRLSLFCSTRHHLHFYCFHFRMISPSPIATNGKNNDKP